MPQIAAIILAAGEGTRMKSDIAKVLHPVVGLPLVAYPLSLCRAMRVSPVILVVARKNDLIRKTIAGLNHRSAKLVVQHPPLGTGHAVQMGMQGEIREQASKQATFAPIATVGHFCQYLLVP
ncbi:MAG: NTP transferase domain-containing protein [Deltaproteobacteria bacterium]|nr:NTP transferase domain-containing protein [Deltaproteobacteria bacterium]